MQNGRLINGGEGGECGKGNCFYIYVDLEILLLSSLAFSTSTSMFLFSTVLITKD